MIRSLWTARTGLDAHQTSMDVITNNLANVSTNGFKRSRAVFEDLLYQNMRTTGAQSSQATAVPSGLMIGSGVRPIATEHIYTQGSVEKTDNPLDLGIQGNGFFRVTLPDGTSAYTRDGSFTKNAEGQIVTANGYLVDPPIAVPPEATNLSISRDGVVSITVPGQTAPVEIGRMQLSLFVNNGGLIPLGQNLFAESASSGVAAQVVPGEQGAGVLNQGYVETSNVNVAEELVAMIIAQRGYEMNSKAITVSDQMLARLSQI